MSQAQHVIDRHGQKMVNEATKVIGDDIREIFLDELEFTSQSPVIGQPLIETLPLTAYTIAQKIREGAPRPEIPRIRTGALFNSIAEDYGHLAGTISVADDEKAQKQQAGESYSRPYFGVSDRALTRIETDVEKEGALLVAELDSLQLPGITVTA